MRNAFDCPDIFCDFLADAAVPACRRSRQNAIHVEDAARYTVDLRLGSIGHGLVLRQFEEALQALFKIGDVLGGKGVVERQHGNAVNDRREFFGDRRTDLLRRTVGRFELGELRFEIAQLFFKRVVFGVGQFRRFLPVIEVAVIFDLRDQFGV